MVEKPESSLGDLMKKKKKKDWRPLVCRIKKVKENRGKTFLNAGALWVSLIFFLWCC